MIKRLARHILRSEFDLLSKTITELGQAVTEQSTLIKRLFDEVDYERYTAARTDADGCYTLPDGSCAGCPHCPCVANAAIDQKPPLIEIGRAEHADHQGLGA